MLEENIFQKFLNLLFPPACFSCEKILLDEEKDLWVCRTCRQKVRLYQTLFCASCFSRLANNKPNCHKNFPYLLGAAANYSDPVVQKLIWQLKYKGKQICARFLAKTMAEYFFSLNFNPKEFFAIPTPLHRQKLRKRGFNQAELLAREFCFLTGTELLSGALVRIKNTKPQAEMRTWAHRQKNIFGSFKVRDEAKIPEKIILIDDVSTSGATLKEAAAVLRLHGAKKIIGLVVARAN